ncbi:IclR family acetate operon transcriptional repressor [Streptomyces ambofaciens]
MPTSSASTTDSARSATGGVQSLERAFDLLERMADAGGEVGLSELSASSGLPLPTIHRLMRTLVACGYVRQQPNRRYALGPRLIRLGESASRLLGTWARPHLARLVEETGETANMALLDGDEIVYVAQVPSKHSMRMFTEVGRRVLPHSTGVGKALLADFPADEVRALLGRTGMPAATDKTITTPDGFIAALEEVRRQGYAIDDNEQEIGVRCLAVSVPDSPTAAAISISGPAGRVTEGRDGPDGAPAPAGGGGAVPGPADLERLERRPGRLSRLAPRGTQRRGGSPNSSTA